MKKFLLKLLIGIPFLLISLFLFVNLAIPNQYDTSYQRAISRQYNTYKTMGENKIILIGGSSLSFGLDLNRLEELSGRSCQILGNHAGMGLTYFIEMSKCNIKKGDVVIIEYANHSVNTLGTELLLTGIENNFEMYRFFRLGNLEAVVKGYPNYVSKKIEYCLFSPYVATGSYSMEAYDQRGNMTYPRDGCIIPTPFTKEVEEIYGVVSWGNNYDEEFIEYINEYISYCNQKGAQVLVTKIPWLDEAVRSSKSEIISSDETLRNLLAAPLISSSLDYIYGREYMYNSIAHCNTAGVQKRTEQLYLDMLPYLN
ncbi:MAG: hypothetical protein RR463_07680 [Hydrogenoanaerobacterium sp.]